MKILLQQFLAQSHSWSVVGQNIGRSLIKSGHNVDLFSTNGIKYFPNDLKPNLIGYFEEGRAEVNGKAPDNSYDCQISYTAMKNFPAYLSHGDKNRFGIWCYEFAGKGSLPVGFAKHYKSCDKILAPSKFAKEVFAENGVPEDHIIVVPHGFDSDKYLDNSRPIYKLKTKKSFKILSVMGQVHKRKNLDGLLEAYGKAFTNKDDVCLVLKVVDKPIAQPFEVSFRKIFNDFKNKFKNHGEVEVITDFIEDIDILYRACDALFSPTHSECFALTPLEALAAGKLVIMSNWGGQLDFLNKDNSLLIDGKEIFAPPTALYWQAKSGTKYFLPDINDSVDKLRFAFNNRERLVEKFKGKINFQEYSWDNVSKKIINLCV